MLITFDDYKHTVSLPTPHDGGAVRHWLAQTNIRFTYSTHNINNPAPTVEYHFIKERDATLFALKWS